MNIQYRRLLILTLVVACLSAAVGAAFAVVTNTSSEPLTRDQVYHQGMSLEEIAAAASGRPGEIAPPCPDVATANRLKESGVAFGPCDLVPEEGAPVRIADPQEERTPKDDVVCPGVILGKGVDLKVMLPCARGAEIVEATAVAVGGRQCAKVTYIAGSSSPSRTETLCEGDVPSVGGPPVRGPSATEKHTE
jgi:hypothetical protein